MKHKLVGMWPARDYWLDGIKLDPAPSQRIINHSPDGFNHSYSGSGPAQLALAIAIMLGKKDNYQQLKQDVIAQIPRGSFDIEFTWDGEHGKIEK